MKERHMTISAAGQVISTLKRELAANFLQISASIDQRRNYLLLPTPARRLGNGLTGRR
jgi:hypothetical protein